MPPCPNSPGSVSQVFWLVKECEKPCASIVVQSPVEFHGCRPAWEMTLLTKIIFVGLGGFIGATLRYAASGAVGRITTQTHYGTFVVNIVGCLLIGFLAGFADARDVFSTTARAFVFTGILGAFTTFSTFSYETMGLFQNGQTSSALTNLGLQIFLGLLAVFGGIQLSRLF